MLFRFLYYAVNNDGHHINKFRYRNVERGGTGTSVQRKCMSDKKNSCFPLHRQMIEESRSSGLRSIEISIIVDSNDEGPFL